MSVASTNNQVIYVGSGTTGPFDFDFVCFVSTDLLVQKLTIATDVIVDLTETTDYTVTIDGDGTGHIDTVATVTSSYKLIITRVLPLTQEISYVENDKFPSTSHEEALDRGVMIDQQLQEQIDRCIKVNPGESVTAQELLADIDAAVAATAADVVTAEAAAGTATTQAGIATAQAVLAQQYASSIDPDTVVSGNGTVGLVNLLQNGDFENWSAGTSVAPDYWTAAGASVAVARESSTIKLGTYSAKVTKAVNQYAEIKQDFTATRGIAYWKGRKVTLSCWVSAARANMARLQITDGVNTNQSSFHSGGGTYELLTVTATIDSSATAVIARLFVTDVGATSDIVYFDGAILSEGASQFAFTPHPNDQHKFKVGLFSRDMTGATADVAYTGIGFTPKTIIFLYGIGTASKMLGVGIADVASAHTVSQRGDATGSDPLDYAIGAAPNGTDYQRAVVKSLDADGFTLTWTKVNSPTGSLNVYYLAIG